MRRLFGLRPAPEFAAWLEERGTDRRGRRLWWKTPRGEGSCGSSNPSWRRREGDADESGFRFRAARHDPRRRQAAARARLRARAGQAARGVLQLRHLAVDHLHPGRRRDLVPPRALQRGRGVDRPGLAAGFACSRWWSRRRWAQLASAFPTAGGLYHWASILGGRGWGWATAWFNLAGLVTVLAAINVGTYRFAARGAWAFTGCRSGLGMRICSRRSAWSLITATQAAINHLGIGVTARLTDFSGYWILLIAFLLDGLPAGLRPVHRPVAAAHASRTSAARPAAEPGPGPSSSWSSFALGALLPAYTITGFDASAHASEETVGAARSVPRGIVRSVLVSGIAGWVFLSAVVLAAPSSPAAASQAKGRSC